MLHQARKASSSEKTSYTSDPDLLVKCMRFNCLLCCTFLWLLHSIKKWLICFLHFNLQPLLQCRLHIQFILVELWQDSLMVFEIHLNGLVRVHWLQMCPNLIPTFEPPCPNLWSVVHYNSKLWKIIWPSYLQHHHEGIIATTWNEWLIFTWPERSLYMSFSSKL